MRKIIAFVMTSAAVAAGLVGAGPAAAADATCPFTRTVCLWDGVNFTGTRFTVQSASASTQVCVDLAAHRWGNGRAKAAKNTGNQIAVLYSGTDCTGSSYQLIPQGGYGSITFGSNSILVS